jgi:hypothetical protein
MNVQHENIIMKWIIDPTTSMEHLVFEYQAQHIWAQLQNVNIKVVSWVIRDACMVEIVK